jgi:hypothetical protein
MAFAQLMEFRTSDKDAVDRVRQEWEQATGGKRSANRIMVMQHHDDPNTYFQLVVFDSYESAMENSDLPETQEYAEKLRQQVEGDISYINLDLVEEAQL